MIFVMVNKHKITSIFLKSLKFIEYQNHFSYIHSQLNQLENIECCYGIASVPSISTDSHMPPTAWCFSKTVILLYPSFDNA